MDKVVRLFPNDFAPLAKYQPLFDRLKNLLKESNGKYEVVRHKHYSDYPAWCYQTPHNRRHMTGYLAREAIFNVLGLPFHVEIDEYHQESVICMYIHKDLGEYADALIDAYNEFVKANPSVDATVVWRKGLCSYNQPNETGKRHSYQVNEKHDRNWGE